MVKISGLIKCFKEAKCMDAEYVGVVVDLGGIKELIINRKENFDFKLDYYKEAYNENLELKYNNSIKIVGFAYGYEIYELGEKLYEKGSSL